MVLLTEGSLQQQQQHLHRPGGRLLEWNVLRPQVSSAKSETVVGGGGRGSDLGLNTPRGCPHPPAPSSLTCAGMDGSQSPHGGSSPVRSLQGSAGAGDDNGNHRWSWRETGVVGQGSVPGGPALSSDTAKTVPSRLQKQGKTHLMDGTFPGDCHPLYPPSLSCVCARARNPNNRVDTLKWRWTQWTGQGACVCGGGARSGSPEGGTFQEWGARRL